MRILRTLRALALACTVALVGCDLPTDPEGDDGGSSSATITVVNRSSSPIFFVYISDCSNSNWGQDQLNADETISTGSQRSWTVTPGCYDVRAELGDERFAERFDQTVASGATFTWTITN